MTGIRQEHRIRRGKGSAEPILEIVPRESADAHARAQAIRVVVATDLSLYRDGLARTLAGGEGVEVIATASTAADAVAIVGDLRPDVLVLDAAIPGGSRTVAEVVEVAAATKVVVIAVPANDDDIITYVGAGASGFVSRSGSPSELLAAVTSAARGELLYPPEVAATWRKRMVAPEGRTPFGRQPQLTRRELQVVELVDRGLSNKEIAQALAVSVPTVKNHVHAILKKLAVQRRSQAAAKVRQLRDQTGEPL
jgi:DNA-binding NarL/FixJ family response regulator